MAKNNNLTDFLTDLGDAIRAKKGMTDLINPQDFADLIASIQTGGGSGGGGGSVGRENDVIFYDHDGSVICSYSVEEAKALTEMPAAPDHEGLAFLRWTHSLQYLQENDGALDVAALYKSANGRTQLYITIEDEYYLDFTLYLKANGTDNGVIYWGDGESTPITDKTAAYFTHTYASLGDYVIEIENLKAVTNLNAYITIGNSTTSPSYSTTFGTDSRRDIRATCLRRVVIGDNFRLGNYVFQYCTNLESAILGDITGELPRNAFANCYSLKYLAIPDNIGTNYAVFNEAYRLSKVVISEACTSLGSSCFYKCYGLDDVILPKGLSRINGEAFRDCTSLKKISIPAQASVQGGNVFNGCSALADIQLPSNISSASSFLNGCVALKAVKIPDGASKIPGTMFDGCWSLESIEIPNTVTEIGSNAFYECRSLDNVEIPSSVTKIGSSVFYECSSLKKVVIPDTVASIDTNYMCYYCKALESVTLLESDAITTLGYAAFSNCKNLTRIRVPKNYTIISNYAFNGCTGMIFYDFSEFEQVPSLEGTSAFQNMPADTRIIVPDALFDEWIAATNWSVFAANIVKASEYNG